MNTTQLDALVEPLQSVVFRAGAAIMAYFQQKESNTWEIKEDLSPVSQADRAAHQILTAGLSALLPDVPVVSEEDPDSLVHRIASDQFWLIDPLDGTKEFLSRDRAFTVNVALIEKGVPVLGMVFAPAMDLLYWGGKGLGAYRKREGVQVPIQIRHHVAGIVRVVASKSHLNRETEAYIEKLGPAELKSIGSSLKICLVAEGAADVYPRMGPTCEWDTAAAQAVLEAAGGRVVDLSGRPLLYGKPDVLNPHFVALGDPRLGP